MVEQLKKNSKVAIMLRGMLTGYEIKERYHELAETYDAKRKNVEQRQATDRELLSAQDQVIHYLRESNKNLQWLMIKAGAGDRLVINQVFRDDKRLRLELQRRRLKEAVEIIFDKFSDRNKVVDLLQNLRQKRMARLGQLQRDMAYLERIGLDKNDEQLAQERRRIENNIEKIKIKMNTAHFIRDRYQNLLVQWEEDMSQFTFRLDSIRTALRQNVEELHDIETIRVEAKETSVRYVHELAKVENITTDNRSRREEAMAAQLREQVRMRFEFLKERERRASAETGSVITTDAIPGLQEKIDAAKMEILRYAEMFQGMRQKTMVEAHETVAHIVTQTDIFEELRRRKSDLLSKLATLQTELDGLRQHHEELKFTGEQLVMDKEREIEELEYELAALDLTFDTNTLKLEELGDIRIKLSSGIEVLFGKLKTIKEDGDPRWTGEAACEDCEKLSLCADRMHQLLVELSAEPTYLREAQAKMQCTLFQEPLEDFANQPPIQLHMLPHVPSATQLDFDSNVGSSVLTREQMKKKSEKLVKSKSRAPVD